MEGAYHEKLKLKMDAFVHEVYKITRNFPKEELYGVTSQLRRAALSIILNYVEGYARRRGQNCKTYKNFLSISYGSLKETNYLLHFSMIENFLDINEYKKIIKMGDEIGAMIYKTMN